MADLTIQTQQPKRRPNTALMACAGAAVGSAARYVLPTKSEFKGLFNKENMDTFVSSAATAARANSRSIVKYGVIGGLVAGGITMIAKALSPNKHAKEENEAKYSKYQAILDSSDYACQIMWWGD